MPPAPSSRITAVSPLWAVEGGRVTISGSGFALEPQPPEVRLGGVSAPSRTRRDSRCVIVPRGSTAGTRPSVSTARRARRRTSRSAAPFATGAAPGRQPGVRSRRQPLRHLQRDARPAGAGLDLRRAPGRHARAVRRRASPTRRRWRSIRGAGCTCRAASRAASTASRATDRVSTVATDLGVACGIAFDRRRRAVRRRSIRIDLAGRRTAHATVVRVDSAERRGVPPRLRPRRLAVCDGADACRRTTRCTASSPDGAVETFCDGFGRPQGLAFDSDGHLYVVDALAGASGLYRIRTDRPDIKDCVLSGGALLGLAFDPLGGLVVSSSDTVYRLDVGLRGVLPVQPAVSPISA